MPAGRRARALCLLAFRHEIVYATLHTGHLPANIRSGYRRLLRKIIALFSGEGLKARAGRSIVFAFGGVVASNLLRLISNLILTRLLFPEAFGLMALVQVFMGALQMFSDTGTRLSIMQNKRGDDPDFLNTAWTLQIVRGLLLWLGACALAWPAAAIYDEPLLMWMLPVVGLGAVIQGFTTTNVATANRHMRIGRQTAVEIGVQAVNILTTALFAWWLQSVWALVFGGLAAGMIKVVTLHLALPGIRNRLRWDPTAFRDMFQFGKYIFLSSIAGFIAQQADRAILGAYISLADLGIYSIAFLIGMLPLVLCRTAVSKVVIPLYRELPTLDNPRNRQKLYRARRILIGPSILLCGLFGFLGIAIIEFLYDERYHLAGPMVTLFSLAILPQITLAGYNGVLLANGDSRRYFQLLVTTTCLQLASLVTGITLFGIPGAILGPGIGILLAYPLRVRFINRYRANDPKSDVAFFLLGYPMCGLACWWHWDKILPLFS